MDRTLTGMIVVSIISVAIFIGFVSFNKQIAQLTQAKEDTIASPEKSLIFAWPLTVPADAKTPSEITVFVRNPKGKAMENKSITLSSSLGELNSVTQTTGNDGKALFRLTSDTKGVAEIQAVVDNNTIEKKVTIKFE